jgi:hypothetical protein
MLTLAEAKTLLGVGSDKDASITALLPLLEDAVIRQCKNDFTVTDSATGATDGTTTITVGTGNTITNGKIYIDGYGVYNVLSGTDTTIVVDEALGIDTITYRVIRYPRGLKIPVSKLLRFHLGKVSVGIKSESIFDYSVSYDTDIPDYLKSDFNRYSKYNFLV